MFFFTFSPSKTRDLSPDEGIVMANEVIREAGRFFAFDYQLIA